MTGKLELTKSKETYSEGENISVRCEVLRAKGNISTDNLQVSLGHMKLNGVTMTENSDGTKRLSFHRVIITKPEYQNAEFNCKYITPFGFLQNKSFRIEISKYSREPTCFFTSF